MASRYQTNLNIGAGEYFYQEFSMTNPDFTPVDLSGLKIFAAMAKHGSAVDATKPLDGFNNVSIPIKAEVLDGTVGRYYLEMETGDTVKLSEGKYVYSVMIEYDPEKQHLIEALGGLVFVSKAFGMIRNQETDEEVTDGGGGPDPEPEPGSGGDDGGPGEAPD